jgi:hypothetical protein
VDEVLNHGLYRGILLERDARRMPVDRFSEPSEDPDDHLNAPGNLDHPIYANIAAAIAAPDALVDPQVLGDWNNLDRVT